MKKKYKLLLVIAVILILITCTYATFQPPITLSSDLANPNSSEIVSPNDLESSRRESSSVSENKTKACLTCNDTGTVTKTIENYLTCPACTGTGKITCHYCDGSGHFGTDICTGCLGAGLQTCPDCGGKGYKSETVTTREKCPNCIANKH